MLGLLPKAASNLLLLTQGVLFLNWEETRTSVWTLWELQLLASILETSVFNHKYSYSPKIIFSDISE